MMSETRFYPTKLVRERVQFTAEELEILLDLVWRKINNKRKLGSEDKPSIALIQKLNRAHARATGGTGKTSGPSGS